MEKYIDMQMPLTSLDHNELSEELNNLTALERISWAYNQLGDGLFALTSAGVDSALMVEHVAKSNLPISFIFLNTGFLPKETLVFKDELTSKYGVQILEVGPSQEEIEIIRHKNLWETDLETYTRITKLEPLSRAIEEYGITGLLSAVRSDQTENRSSLNIIGTGNDGELRINPFLDWSQPMIDAYFTEQKLPRNSLFSKGYGSVEDAHTMKPGANRQGRARMECGLHLVDGKLVRQKPKAEFSQPNSRRI